MRYLNMFVLVLLVLLLPSCGKKKSTDSPPKQKGSLSDYLPLQLGNWWKYERVFWEQGGYTFVDTFTETVVEQDTVLGDKIAFRLEEDGGVEEEWLVIFNDELRLYEELPEQDADYYVFLKLPIEVGNKWNYYPGYTLKAEIVSTNAAVEVPAGTFKNCIHVCTPPYFNAWYAKEIGGIQWTNCDIDSIFGLDERLIEYHVK